MEYLFKRRHLTPWLATLVLALAVTRCYSEPKVSSITHVNNPNSTPGGIAGATGPAGLTIQPFADGGKCLQALSVVGDSNLQVTVGTCNGSSAQRWAYVAGQFQNVQAKQCLDVGATAAINANALLTLQPCASDRPAQAWIVDRSILYVANGNSPFGMALSQTPPQQDTAVKLATVDFASNAMRWVVNVTVPGGSGQISEGFAIQPTASPNDCLDMDGNTLVTNPCTGSANQRWMWLVTGQLQATNSNNCISLPTGATADGTQATIVACDPNSAPQQWISTGGEFVDTAITKCAEAGGPNAPVTLVTCNGAATQQWQMGVTAN